ncbi:MAG: DUF4388 domain-containing protein [Myxococcota bacterium]
MTAAKKRTILIADPDVEVARSLKSALQEQYEILVARDGSKALETSVLRYPDLILFYRNCPLIGATQFLRILRTNPRTEDIPLIVLSDEAVSAGSMPGFLEGILVKPLNLDEVRSHIAQVFRRSDAVREVGHEAGSVSGNLEQISMADLLQVFSMNRRTGVLQLQGGGTSAEVFVNEGRIEEAICGLTRGEKALYRIIGMGEGRFSFVPGRQSPVRSLDATTDALLIEGMRQSDELERMRDELPPPAARIEQAIAPDEIPPGLHPVNAEIMSLLGSANTNAIRVTDVVDRTKATDLDVYLALRSLLTAGFVRIVDSDGGVDGKSLLTQDESFELRSRLRRIGLPPSFMGAPKLVLVMTDPADVRATAAMMQRWSEFEPALGGELKSFGSLGILTLDHGLVVDVVALSADPALAPLGYALSAGAIAAIVMGPADELNGALRLVEVERRASVVFLRFPGQPAIADAPRRTILPVASLAEAELRQAVQTALRHGATADLRGMTI